MTQTALPLLAQCLLTLAAFASLCLATPRHIQRLKTSRPQQWRTPLRWVGWSVLTAALTTAVISSGWGLGLVEWFGALTLAAVTVVLIATYRPTWLKAVTWAGLLLGLGTLSAMLYV
ncbi:DUF3325 domain-containing protein [Marinimicrobium agarilyticum]|uniref:DUF3325 domain-containing protein n=1 Tax=Marinimicrobium agarilyticum TaxID=306546 RepID=UPI0004257A02|nr:DUF3325 domain-containing protein [Marinimicrobium agarilyticum]